MRPIDNLSKNHTCTERNYSHIHREARDIIFSLRKLYQYRYGRLFIFVTYSKPVTALFDSKGKASLLATNQLAQWILWLKLFGYTIECRKTVYQENVLSRLPSGDDNDFDWSECGVCPLNVRRLKVKSAHANILHQEFWKDPLIITVMRYETIDEIEKYWKV